MKLPVYELTMRRFGRAGALTYKMFGALEEARKEYAEAVRSERYELVTLQRMTDGKLLFKRRTA